MVQAVPAASGDQAGSVAQAVPAGSAVPEGSAAQAGLVGLAAQAVPGGREALAVQVGLGGREALAVQAVPAAGKPPIVRRGVLALAVAPAPRRGPLTVLLGGRTSAGREARRWAESEWAGPTPPSPIAAQ